MLTEEQKVQIRRHLGYPVAGNPVTSPVGGATFLHGFQGYRFFQVYGTLEYRMNWMQPIEEICITGQAVAVVTVSAAPNNQFFTPGLSISLTITTASGLEEVVTYTVTASDEDIYVVGVGIANAILADAALVGEGFSALSPLTGGTFAAVAKPPATVQPFPGIQVTAPLDFQILPQSSPPLILSVPLGLGRSTDPKATIDDEERRGYLQILSTLEAAIATSSENLDTEKADVWTARKDEVQIRTELYDRWRMKLAKFLAIPLWEDTGYDITRGQRGSISLIA